MIKEQTLASDDDFSWLPAVASAPFPTQVLESPVLDVVPSIVIFIHILFNRCRKIRGGVAFFGRFVTHNFILVLGLSLSSSLILGREYEKSGMLYFFL